MTHNNHFVYCYYEENFICLFNSVAIKCDDPGPLQNGFQEGSLNFSYGAEIRYMCKAGYVIFGSPTRTCSEEGRWTGVKPFCVGNYFDVAIYCLSLILVL